MRKGLLISTMLVSVAGLGASADVWAQCATTTCSALGYTSSSNTGDCLKCPFGEAWACPKITCPDNAKYTCSGTNIIGGVDIPCNGKYAECACANGYEWKDGSCVKVAVWGKCTEYAEKNCSIGDILFSDGTCASDAVSGKTPIAIVVYISDKGCGQAMALNSIGRYIWGGDAAIQDLPFVTTSSAASQDYASCENSKIIMVDGDNSVYPAAWATYKYSTTGTKAGDWCLPAAGIFTSYYDNQEKINTGFDKAGGTKFTTSTYAWSSTNLNASRVWYLDLYSSYGLFNSGKYSTFEVRPVIEFSSGNSGTPSCDSSYQYTCTGTGYSGGSGTACGGKYKACTCSSGYSWENGSCVKQCDDYCRSYNGYCPNGTLEPNGTDGCGNTCYQCCVPYEDVTTDVYCFYGDTISTITSHCENYSTDDKGKYKLATPYKRIKNGETTIHKHCRLSYKTLSECEQASESYKDRIGVSNTKKECHY